MLFQLKIKKWGLKPSDAEAKLWYGANSQLWRNGCSFLINDEMPVEAHVKYGAPKV